MNKILFIGYSNLIKNRILPIINRLPINSVSIAKYEGQDWADYPILNQYHLYDSYEEGLSEFDGNIVYVSTVNSAHYKYAKKALENGFNVIIDKPATLDYNEIEELVSIARTKKLLISESIVYLCHPQLMEINKIFKRNEDKPKLLTVHFSMPPFDSKNFRYKKELGGGAMFDTLPYAISISRFFFDSNPKKISVNINERNRDNLDIEYSLLMAYPEGKCMIGHFGFNTEYINNIRVLGSRTNVEVNRIFTIPENMDNQIVVDHMNKREIINSGKGNNFEIYLRNYIKCLETKNYNTFYEILLQDAKVKQEIIDKIK